MNIKNILTIGSLEFKITDEKLFIQTINGSETYALRSINGISVKDVVVKYNQDVNDYKYIKKKTDFASIMTKFTGVVGIVCLFVCLSGSYANPMTFWFGLMLVVFTALMYNTLAKQKIDKPKLRSLVCITMNSGDKVFEFSKEDANSSEVADFVATLESTLTAFHKN